MVSAITVVAPPPVHAAKKKKKGRTKKQKVRRYKKRAFKAFSKGDYARGIKHMRKAHGLIPHPGFLLNIAVAYDQWGEHCGEALETFEEFFEACPDCKLRPKATTKRGEVRERCPTLARIETDPAGAALEIDGETSGMTPQTLKLTPGPHTLRVARPGFTAREEQVEVTYGAENRFEVALEAIVAAAPPPAVAPPPAAPPPAAPPPAVHARLEPVETPPTDLTPWAWTAFGVAAAGAAVGAVFTVQTMSALDAEEQARIERRTKREVEDLQDDAVNKAIIANVGFGVAAAGAVAGVVLLILDPDDPDAADDLALTPLIGPGGVGVLARF